MDNKYYYEWQLRIDEDYDKLLDDLKRVVTTKG